MSLVKLRTGKSTIDVATIIANAELVKEAGNFSKVVTKDKEEFFYLTDSETDIDENPTSYVVRHSAKHDADFIVPKQSNGFNKF